MDDRQKLSISEIVKLLKKSVDNSNIKLGYQAKIRQLFIKDYLQMTGSISRDILIDYFGIKAAQATRDLSYYRKTNNNIEYDVSNKIYKLKAKQNDR